MTKTALIKNILNHHKNDVAVYSDMKSLVALTADYIASEASKLMVSRDAARKEAADDAALKAKLARVSSKLKELQKSL